MGYTPGYHLFAPLVLLQLITCGRKDLASLFAAGELVERLIPIFPDRLDTECTQGSGYLARLALIADVELLQRLRIGVVASRIGLALRTHRGHAEACHVVTEGGTLASGIGNIDIVVEDAGGKGDLRQLTIAHHDIGLKTAILRRTHPGEIEAVFRFPIMLLQVAQMIRHHGDVGAPLLFQSHQDTHADGVYASLSHTVEAIHAPLKVGLHATGMVDVVVCLVIGLLETDHPVHTVMPLGAPIGTNRGLRTKDFLQIIIEQAGVPVVVDAGIGSPSHAAEAMELGASAVLVNTAIAIAADPVRMANAFRQAVEAGREAYEAGLGSVSANFEANASSPLTAFLQ